ncbi:MAG: type II toxin-antitoxin system VapC family toxin [Kiritimatiellae bacterium]|nr:type II toxin-antitoxin system VapC family toxin [Kiritimatiellia bacterium]MBR4188556.1 type II toxin-antitoxin system VapC family toxin [Kiritimatiellia bacterium]MBR4252163.1 type II toxin-antitoxin system VapC family toxin [Kiritimatiellia bacterium]
MILLDTNAWLWWTIRPEGMPARARSLADAAAGDGALAVSVVSVWEIAVKTALRKLQLGMAAREWVARASRAPGLRILPVDSDIALASTELPPPFHRDPADRLIVALARRLRAPLLTSDRKILEYPHVESRWE